MQQQQQQFWIFKQYAKHMEYTRNYNKHYGIYRAKKVGKHFNSLEKYHIHLTSKDNLHINDTRTDTYYSTIFETVHQLKPNSSISKRGTGIKTILNKYIGSLESSTKHHHV
jgi:hypothetical protein